MFVEYNIGSTTHVAFIDGLRIDYHKYLAEWFGAEDKPGTLITTGNPAIVLLSVYYFSYVSSTHVVRFMVTHQGRTRPFLAPFCDTAQLIYRMARTFVVRKTRFPENRHASWQQLCGRVHIHHNSRIYIYILDKMGVNHVYSCWISSKVVKRIVEFEMLNFWQSFFFFFGSVFVLFLLLAW